MLIKLIQENKFINKINNNQATFIVVKNNDIIIEENYFGVISLIKHYQYLKTLNDICIYDKLVGRGAALLISSLDIQYVYAKTVTSEAIDIITKNCYCELIYERKTMKILNKDRSDLCPIEKISKSIIDIDELYCKLKNFYEERGFLND